MVFGALRVGLTGLRVNQRYLDVIGNNLTNSDTTGFKADRITFSDVLYQTSRAPSGPTGTVGGVNAQQFGLGAQVGSIDQIHSQGALVTTGRAFDLAIQGKGFFVLSDGTQSLYTRSGAFTLDRASNLVDSRTGLRVQDASGSDIIIDQSSVSPAVGTSSVSFAGNLPADRVGPAAEVQSSANPFEDHQPAVATGGAGNYTGLIGQTLNLNINSGNPVAITFGAGDFPNAGPHTPAEVEAAINGLLPTNSGVTARVATGGEIELVTDRTGDTASLSFSGAAATALGLNTVSVSGSEATAVGTTPLNDLSANSVDYVPGDIINISGVNVAGQAVSMSFVYGAANDGVTLDDLTTRIQTAFPGTNVVLGADGRIEVTSQTTGDTDLTINLRDETTNTGQSNFVSHDFTATTEGTGPDTRSTSITIFDSLGISHTLNGDFERQDDGTWNLSLSADGATISGAPITGISFGTDGTLQGALSMSIDLDFGNGSASQNIDLDFGTVGGLSGLTSFGNESTAQAVSQDGNESGSLSSLQVTQGGMIQGIYSNGTILDLATLGIANFQNEAGLLKEGSTLFTRSDNSGAPIIGQAGIGGAGNLVSGALEGSNVDTAEEFVRLIEAQRSFQGAARIVTTADEIFAELLQII